MLFHVVLITLVLALASAQNISLGNALFRSAGVTAALPLNVSSAVALGWVSYTACSPSLGTGYAYKGRPTSSYPVTLYYTAGGYLAGIGTDAFGNVEPNLISRKYWQVVDAQAKQYRAKVTFRQPGDLCVRKVVYPLLGDRLILNADTIAMNLPVTDMEATSQKWTKGSCIQGMGTHWAYDVTSAPSMSWEDSNLLPVVTMYYRGQISAMFFNVPFRQQSILPPDNNMWDVVPIPSFLMCKNWCDSSCDWNTVFWATMHIFFYHPDYLTCSCSSRVCC